MITTTTARKEYIDELKKLIDRLDMKVDDWETRLKKASNSADNQSDEILDTLKTKREAASRKLKEVQNAGEQAWDDLASGALAALSDLEDAFSKARTRFSNQ